MKIMNRFSDEEWKLAAKMSKYPFSFYRLLGFIESYYAGTFNPRQQMLQRITVAPYTLYNEVKVTYLKQICRLFFNEANLENDLTIAVETNEDAAVTTYTFSSATICNYLNKVKYDRVEELFIEMMKPPFGSLPVAYRQRFEYIIGSYAAHATNNAGEWLFHNNLQKMFSVYKLLTDFGDEGCRISLQSLLAVPHSHRIQFDTNDELWPQIQHELDKMKNNL